VVGKFITAFDRFFSCDFPTIFPGFSKEKIGGKTIREKSVFFLNFIQSANNESNPLISRENSWKSGQLKEN
jgi:hypothetical protein